MDRQDFLKTLAEACQKTAWQVHAYLVDSRGSAAGAHGIPHDTAAGRAEFQLRMEARRATEIDEQTLEAIRQDWCFGSEEFREELVKRMKGRLTEHHAGGLHSESSRVRAERIVAEELRRLGWTELDLAARRKNAPEKLAIVTNCRPVAQRTTLTVKDLFSRERTSPIRESE